MSDFDAEPRSSRWLWIVAAMVALGLHLGGVALALANLRGDGDDDGLGAAGAEFAVEMASPNVPDSDLPPGPDSDASQATPPMPEQKAEVKETDLPKDKPQEAEDPDRIVTENSTKKPDDESPKLAAIETPAMEEQPQAVETARQKLDDDSALESDKAKAPVLGIGKDAQRLTAEWGRKVSAYLEQHLRYPKDKKEKATVTVNLVLNRRGNVVSVDVAESSGDGAFDDAALAMVRRSDPVPAPPAALTQDTFSFRLPVNFNDRRTKRKG
jgi:TonB family protein